MSYNTFDHYFITGVDAPLREQIEQYKRDEFWLDYLTDNGYSYQEAAKIVGSAHFVAAMLAYSRLGLETILVDKHSRAALKQALLARDAGMIDALERCVKILKYKPRGRPPKLVDGKAMGNAIVDLDKTDLTPEVIAKIVGTSVESVRAQLSQARKGGKLPPSPKPRKYRRSAPRK